MTLGEDGVREVTRYVEVPMVEEIITTVPKREIVEIEKRSERVETEFLDRVVEIPEVRTVKKVHEIPTVQEVVKTVTRKEVVAVPKEVIKYVTRKETRVIEEEKRVKGETIEVPKIIDVVKEVIVPRYQDVNVPTIVAQTVVPIVSDENGAELVDAVTYEPDIILVDILIPKPMARPVVCEGKVKENLREVEIPAPQYNYILRHLNRDIIEEEKQVYREMPFRAEADGSIHFLAVNKANDDKLAKMSSYGIPLFHLAASRETEHPIHLRTLPTGLLDNIPQIARPFVPQEAYGMREFLPSMDLPHQPSQPQLSRQLSRQCSKAMSASRPPVYKYNGKSMSELSG